MRPTQIVLFVIALMWGTVMRMGYESYVSDPETSTTQVGYAALIYYGLMAASVILALFLGEAAILGYAIGAFFVGNYRTPRQKK